MNFEGLNVHLSRILKLHLRAYL